MLQEPSTSIRTAVIDPYTGTSVKLKLTCAMIDYLENLVNVVTLNPCQNHHVSGNLKPTKLDPEPDRAMTGFKVWGLELGIPECRRAAFLQNDNARKYGSTGFCPSRIRATWQVNDVGAPEK